MGLTSNLVGAARTLFIPDGESEKFTFKKFDGRLLKQYAVTGKNYPDSKIERVTLKINPSEVGHAQPRLTQKVQTNFPGRFIIFDWGVDLQVMTIHGNTGNLLPDIVQNGLDPSRPIVDFINAKIAPAQGLNQAANKVLSFGSEALLANSSYFDILSMSQKYRTFTKLQQLYLKFDADTDICTLEFGEFVYRIFFVNFNFTQTAESPWNWGYDIEVNILVPLHEFNRKGDESFNYNDNVDRDQ
jgi:hypothetical protein